MRIHLYMFGMLLLLTGCQESAPPEVAQKSQYEYPPVESAWLDTEGRLYTERRAVSPEGIDIRSACYQLKSDSLQFVMQLRNYDARMKDAPDNQWIVQADVFADRSDDVQLPDNQIPIRMLPMHDHKEVLLQTVELDDFGQVSKQTTHLQKFDHNGVLTEVPNGEDLYPLGVDEAGQINCWPVSSLQLDRGMLHSTRDLASGNLLIDPAGVQVSAPLANFRINADPVSPAKSRITYTVDFPDTELPVDVEWQFPYHMSYSAESWIPPLFELQGGRLATLLFLPDASGKSSRANYNGIFRLASLDPADGDVAIIHEDIPPKLTILQHDGTLFYCCPTNGDDAARWEIWASDSSGLRKRRLYVSDDSVYLNLADIVGSRLLFFRQFFAREDSSPVLFSELLEVSTEGLGRGVAKLERRLGGVADPSGSGIPPINF